MAVFLTSAAAAGLPDFPKKWFLNAHNCYPQPGQDTDPLGHALRTGLTSFEIDLAWSPEFSRTAVSHENPPATANLTLETHFFVPMEPVVQRLPRGQPGYLLLLDFKGPEPQMVRYVYDLLGSYRPWLTLFGDEIEWGPLTVFLTGNASAILQFRELSSRDSKYLAMANREPSRFEADPSAYFREPADNFYRFYNFNWGQHVEQAKNPEAGAFTAVKRARLRALVGAAKQKGYWLRFWTLNGTSLTWGPGSSFGSREAVLERWQAAHAEGVAALATDEYEWAVDFLATR
jgi:hypothetical protein